MRRFFLVILPLISVTGCGGTSYDYRRVDTVFIDGVVYHSEIYSASYYETGFSPDLGSKRVNVTNYANKNQNIYQLDLPNGGGLWMWDHGIPAIEEAIQIGRVYQMTPELTDVIRVDSTTHPTKIHYITKPCADDPQRTECVDWTVFTVIKGGHRNKQAMAPVQFDYLQDDDEDLMIFGRAPYFVCPKEKWSKSRRLAAAFEGSNKSGIIIERGELNWAIEGDLVAPCNVKVADGYLGKGVDGIWRPLKYETDDFYYLGMANKGKINTVSIGAPDKLNDMFFKEISIEPKNVRLKMSAGGSINVYYNPGDESVYFFGLNDYTKLKFVPR